MMKYIDEEEKEIIESLYNESWTSDFNEEVKGEYESYAKNYFDFKNKVEINLTDKDYHNIQIKAIEAGMPYQSLISMLIHKYNEGKIALTV